MKHVLSLALLAAAPIVSAAAPVAPTPAPVPARAEPAPPSIERQMLARQFVAKTVSSDQYLDGIRAMAAAQGDCGCDSKASAASAKAETPEDADKATADLLAFIEPKIKERIPNLMEAYAQAYAREFTADELKQMLTFAESPAGRHYLSSRLDVETDPAVMIQQEGFMLDIIPAMQEFQKQKCQEHKAQLIAAGDKNAKCVLTDKPDVAAG